MSVLSWQCHYAANAENGSNNYNSMTYITMWSGVLVAKKGKRAFEIHKRMTMGNYRSNNSHGFKPVCFLKAVLKWEMEEYPRERDTSVTLSPFSYNRYLACSIRWP